INKSITKVKVLEYVKITAGAVMMGIALSVFLVPFKIAPGGISGLATVIHYLSGIRVSVLIPLINIPIFILGIIRLRSGFLLRSVYGTAVLSVAAEAAEGLAAPTSDPLLACVFGGALMGVGISVVLAAGGTTGGTDILVLVIRRSIPSVSVGRLYLLIDGIIILIAGVALSGGDTVFYSAAALVVSTYATDAALDGLKLARLVYIISDDADSICGRIYGELRRGVTGLRAVSMYSGRERKILLCAVGRRQLTALKRIIRETDPAAFVIICDAKEIMGCGFEVREL
ncbi:MAG: YitT family protein, partial [Clostridia bacterium]|nr:YitT family protein [Clostridia bacterium]